MHICTLATSIETSPQAVWQLWTNVKHWPTWDKEIQSVDMQGLFRQGSTGTITYQDGSTRPFTVIKCEMLESYVLSIPYLHGTEMLIKRSVHAKGQQVEFEQEVNLLGTPFAKLRLRGKKDTLASAFEQQLRLVIELLQGGYSAFQEGNAAGARKATT